MFRVHIGLELDDRKCVQGSGGFHLRLIIGER